MQRIVIRLRSPATYVLTLMAAYVLTSAKENDEYLMQPGSANGANQKLEKSEPIHHRE